MDISKSIPMKIAMLVIGSVFVLLGLSGGVSAGGYSILIDEMLLRVFGAFLGLLFIALSIYLELRSRHDIKELDKNNISNLTESLSKTKADSFFYTLDDKTVEGFNSMVKNAIKISIISRTAINLLSHYQKTFEQLGKSNCEFRFMFHDPNSDACNYIYGTSPDIYRNNILTAASHIKNLRSTMGRRLQVKITKHAPAFSMIIIEKQEANECLMQIQIYFLHSALGRDRPIFRLSHIDKWYGIFLEEFNRIWSDGKEWDESQYIQTVKK